MTCSVATVATVATAAVLWICVLEELNDIDFPIYVRWRSNADKILPHALLQRARIFG